MLAQEHLEVGADRFTALQPNRGRLLAFPVQIDIGEGRWLGLQSIEVMALADPVQDRLDMLAGTELIGRKIRAGAMVRTSIQGPDVDPILRRKMGGGLDGTRAPEPSAGAIGGNRQRLHPDLGPGLGHPLLARHLGGVGEPHRVSLSLGIGEQGGDGVDTKARLIGIRRLFRLTITKAGEGAVVPKADLQLQLVARFLILNFGP